MTYSSLFKCKRLHTILLQDTTVLNSILNEGFKWIRRIDKVEFHTITRYPTMGCIVEVFTSFQAGCVEIESRKGQKLIRRLCYV
jgi:hypothetical protein